MNKYVLWIVLLVIAVSGFLIYRYNYKNGGYIGNYESASPSGSENPSASGGVVSGLSYTQAVKLYANTRIQFDALCQAIPKNPVYKNNTKVMFDNRSGDARWFSLDGHAYRLNGDGFVVLNLYNGKLPHAVAVDCGSAKNVTQIILER